MSDSGDTPWLVAAFYAFVSFEPGELRQRRAEWLPLAAAAGLKGTLLLAEEGLNGTLCGPETGLRGFLDQLRLDPRLADLEPKFSWSERQVFHRLKLRIKAEIVTMGRPEIQPAQRQTTDVPPQQWDDLIADPDTLVIDTRNTYEVTLGSFDGAIDPATASFRDFPAWVERDLHALVAARQPRRLALFCTGGIRCEKATAYLQQQGFEGVHQLKGGILRYLEEVPESQSRWRGECFVFDQRVALNHRLEPGSHSLCHACGLPLSLADRQQPSYVEGVSCHHCIGQFSNADCARFAERQRQISLARGRGENHIGSAAWAVDPQASPAP
ncbi:rhodanese-related sulfurtransferase [Synechococcus sp. CS-602]|uniref:oxygen-dependent tRNA uridine(34) hydroxylase TrhO n=1 Tax=Synechococcaceae TaxID=1890426 RepID=UPI0008FF4C97|nr:MULTISPECIES: rhodanese-related sulfurtransferase [Synechococcaceae]MCT4363673.1 rhodanese-related sulfurtransferase [Candidatus Regnicoccus frigidus MAG-AL1]APD47336.1 hypothetical protein BM449_02225 [Synechococcus sp. SynAce01]MCT0202765.1 rhodanese-related sulfurtransferase [Synechococcus sp. CS-603]MCT0203678.1 rhodanese-related sulfurtransferase [Synechococcus sp. CS-602]MCT0245325.1 rhodanese-related sulfurtransferase [Synechococcus sp. CS-601]